VTISATATDTVAVERLEISYWDQYLGQEIILGTASNQGSLSATWDTSALTPAAYTVRATAQDALGNWQRAEISVNVTRAAKVMKVTGIALSGTLRGSTASINGTVTVQDASGRAVSGASVAARWTLPGGSTRSAAATTDSQGRARFSTSGGRGTYTLTVENVTRSGYTFDRAGSVLTKSITK
jgi:hypothetical protein